MSKKHIRRHPEDKKKINFLKDFDTSDGHFDTSDEDFDTSDKDVYSHQMFHHRGLTFALRTKTSCNFCNSHQMFILKLYIFFSERWRTILTPNNTQ